MGMDGPEEELGAYYFSMGGERVPEEERMNGDERDRREPEHSSSEERGWRSSRRFLHVYYNIIIYYYYSILLLLIDSGRREVRTIAKRRFESRSDRYNTISLLDKHYRVFRSNTF